MPPVPLVVAVVAAAALVWRVDLSSGREESSVSQPSLEEEEARVVELSNALVSCRILDWAARRELDSASAPCNNKKI